MSGIQMFFQYSDVRDLGPTEVVISRDVLIKMKSVNLLLRFHIQAILIHKFERTEHV